MRLIDANKCFDHDPYYYDNEFDKYAHDLISAQPTVDAIPVEDVAGMLAFAHNGKLPCDLEWYECKKKPCTNGDKSCWLQVLVEGELEEGATDLW